MLEFNSLNALRHEPSARNHAIRLEPDLADAEICGSAVTANALILLRRAADTGGLKLTAIRILTQAAKLSRTHRGKLVPTPLGKRILQGKQYGPLQALLFNVAFWHLNL